MCKNQGVNSVKRRELGRKDPMRQWIGSKSHNQGKFFEARLDAAFALCQSMGVADIEKTPEPMKPIKAMGDGKFLAVYTKKAQADYKGTGKLGRSYVFEAKYTDRDRMEKRRITKAQEDYLNLHQSVGALCFVLVGFGSGRVYRIPWSVWKDMAVCFGREYVREEDLQSFRVHGGSYGVQLDILGDVG